MMDGVAFDRLVDSSRSPHCRFAHAGPRTPSASRSHGAISEPRPRRRRLRCRRRSDGDDECRWPLGVVEPGGEAAAIPAADESPRVVGVRPRRWAPRSA